MRALVLPLLAAGLAAALPATANKRIYPIDIEQELNGLAIEVKSTPGRMAILTLQNKSPDTANCEAYFEGGLATPIKRAAKIKPGKSATLTYTVKDDISRLKVALTCTKA